jgi:5-methylcytosine-specific restriction enzyme subunit McrC
VPLSAAERDAIRVLHPGLGIEPTRGEDGKYDLIPDQWIGVISLPGITVEIRPKVAMSSVLFLVSYGLDDIRWAEHVAEFAHDADLVDVMSILFARMVERATRRGLLTGYQSEDESLAAPRGRVRFDEQIRRWQGVSPPVEVRHDIFTSDVLENRILLAALTALWRIPSRMQATRLELARARRLLGGVRPIEFARASVPDVVFTRLNLHYFAPVSLAKLILQSTSLDLGTGGVNGTAFLVDMNRVFERFVRSALRMALHADTQTFPDRPPRTYLDEGAVIPLKPDLCLVDENRKVKWVGDAKYKRLPAGAYQNADIYQMVAYALALDLPAGTLVYAADEGVHTAEHVIVQSGKRMEVFALDLSAPPSWILRQVDVIARRVERQLHCDLGIHGRTDMKQARAIAIK